LFNSSLENTITHYDKTRNMKNANRKAMFAKRRTNNSQPDAERRKYSIGGHLDVPFVGGIEGGVEVEQLRLKKKQMIEDKKTE